MAHFKLLAATALALSQAGSAQPGVPPPVEDIAPTPIAPTPEDIALARDRYNRMTVPVTIGGQGPYRFFIDTGAQATVVTRRITTDLDLLPSGVAQLVAMGSSRPVQTVEIDELEFADRMISGLVSPLLEREHIGADGILGPDSLQNLRVLIDFREERMSVADAEALGGNDGYEIVVRARRKLGQMIITDAKVNGVRTAVIIDTGSQNSVGNLALFERLRARHHGTQVSTDVHGVELTSDLAFIQRLTIGDMDLTQVPIGFADSPAFDALGYAERPALILGIGNLRVFERVAIDFASRKVLFDLQSSSISDPLRNRIFFPTRIES